ncbi:hypothetical protein [Streptomyces sp. S.PB5]|uniref:hypothetical protein n=1 Tax=Streptomyces sp. S.PB5 TaxID=3020844 RepID=UPI0025B0CBAE|nr:hypothetical protein [Streptomyces sp. S.PB5]MDN3024492.1 hypothetical protein [Streptomyces sp. S.PB5]
MSVSEGREPYGGEAGRGPEGSGGRGPRGRGAGRGPGGRGRDRGRGSGGDASRLPDELRALGRSLDAPGAGGAGGAADGSETMVERVLGQILAEQLQVPVAEPGGTRARLRAVRRWTRLRWRSLTATLCGLLTVLALTPPVRAAVYDWFGFGGVEVRYDPSASPSPDAEVPGCGRSVSLAQAERRAGFEPVVPDALGTPDAVSVSRERQGRFLVSLCWRERGGTVRLDEFAAGLDIAFAKTVREQPEWVSLGDTASDVGGPNSTALWFPRPHLLSFWLVAADGEHYTRKERTAGPTLLWSHAVGTEDVTLRLEGVASKARAVEIAKSLEKSAD